MEESLPLMQEQKGAASSSQIDSAIRGAPIPVTLSLADLRKHFGIGVCIYFRFCLFITLSNLAFAIIGLINWIPHMVRIVQKSEHYSFQFQDLFLSTYKKGPELVLWKYSSIAMSIVSFLLVPLDYWFVWSFMRHDKTVAAELSTLHPESSRRLSQVGFEVHPVHHRVLRMIFSYVVFAGMLVTVHLLTEKLTLAKMSHPIDEYTADEYWYALVVALVNFVVNSIWDFLCYRLTAWEKHRTEAGAQHHNGFKLVAFRVLAMRTIISTQARVLKRHKGGICVTEYMARQFFMFILLDLTLNNLIELSTTYFKRIMLRLGKKIDDPRPDFNVSEEYLEILYRQYLMYIATDVFPLLPTICFATNAVEYYLDRFRLTRLCKPPNMQSWFVAATSIKLSGIALVAILSPPRFIYGWFWPLCGTS